MGLKKLIIESIMGNINESELSIASIKKYAESLNVYLELAYRPEFKGIIIEWIEREDGSEKGSGKLVIEKIKEYAKSVNMCVRLTPESNGSSKVQDTLISYYQSLGFELDPKGSHVLIGNGEDVEENKKYWYAMRLCPNGKK